MPRWTINGGQDNAKTYGGSGMVDASGKAVKSGLAFRKQERLAREFKNQGRLLEYSRVVPVYSGPAYGAASHVHTEVVVNCVIELLPSHEPLEMHDMPEAMEMEKEPSEEVTFEYGLKEGDYVKLVMLSGMTCQWQKMAKYDEKSLHKEARMLEMKQAEMLPGSPSFEAKRMGNAAFKKGDFERASALYTRAISLGGKEDKRTLSVLHSNRAQALLKLGHWKSAISDCNAAILMDAGNIKAHLRRAQGLLSVPEGSADVTEDAEASLLRVLEEEPGNTQAATLLEQVHARSRPAVVAPLDVVAPPAPKSSMDDVDE